MDRLPCAADLFALIICPISGSGLKWVGGRLVSVDPGSRRAYPVEGGMPILLADSAEVLSQPDWEALMAQDGPVSGTGSPALGEPEPAD